MKKDLIVGVYTNYTWDKIKYWANSIDISGFTGDKLMIVYNTDNNTLQKIREREFKVYGFNQNPNTGDLYYDRQLIVVVQRFIDLWNFFSKLELDQYRYVIHTDVKDVIFQTNPSNWLTDNIGDAKILASCESLKYKDEPWGDENLQSSFPIMYEKLKNQPIWNCGVQAGEPNTMRDLWFSIYNLCKGTQIPNPDQAAYNVLLNLEPYKSITKYTMSESAWAAQLGTTMDPLKMHTFLPNLLEPQPIFKDGYVCTSTGIKHTIVHQYDRIPDWRNTIEQRYS
jgi:hypothetical protein